MHMAGPQKYTKKVCLLGDPSVGKTSLIRRFVTDRFDDKYLSTLGTKVSKKSVIVKGGGDGDYELNLLIWDVAGQEQFQRVHASAFKGSDGALVVSDLTRPDTVENMERWAERFLDASPRAALVFLGNKCDLAGGEGRGVSDCACRFGTEHLLTSAKTGANVENAFSILGSMVVAGITVEREEGAGIRAEKEVPPVLKAEDAIIERFCQVYGDYELAMNIVRQQFAAKGVDFRNPTRGDLREIALQLVELLKRIKGEDVASKEREHYLRIMRDL